MCASRSRQSYGGAHRDPDRDHPHPTAQPPHPVPYPYYPPPPYPRCPPYDPYAAYHYPGSFYPTAYCAQHDVIREEPAVWSWPTVALLILLAIGSLVIVYRSISRETRRKIVAWLRSLRFAPQTARTTGTTLGAAQNCPAEFLRLTERNGDHGLSREGRGQSSSLTDTVTFVNPVYEDDDRDESENEESKNVRSEIAGDTERYRSVHRYFHFEK